MIDIPIILVGAFALAVSLAAQNAATVIYMENYVNNKDWQMDRFHRYNVWVKFIFCLVASFVDVSIQADWYTLLIVFSNGLLAAMAVYLVFDPALSIMRPGRNWDYLGVNDDDGKRWVKWFGKNAGQYKAVILSIIIIAIVILKIILWKKH